MLARREIGWSSARTATTPRSFLGDDLPWDFCAMCWAQGRIWSGTRWRVCPWCLGVRSVPAVRRDE